MDATRLWRSDDGGAKESDWAALLSGAAPFGFTPRRDDALEFARRSRVLLLQHTNGVPLDVSCGALTFEELVTTGALPIALGAVTVRLARPEHLLVLKALAGRPQDYADIHVLLQCGSSVDLDWVRRTLDEFAVALDDPAMMQRFAHAVQRARAESGRADH